MRPSSRNTLASAPACRARAASANSPRVRQRGYARGGVHPGVHVVVVQPLQVVVQILRVRLDVRQRRYPGVGVREVHCATRGGFLSTSRPRRWRDVPSVAAWGSSASSCGCGRAAAAGAAPTPARLEPMDDDDDGDDIDDIDEGFGAVLGVRGFRGGRALDDGDGLVLVVEALRPRTARTTPLRPPARVRGGGGGGGVGGCRPRLRLAAASGRVLDPRPPPNAQVARIPPPGFWVVDEFALVDDLRRESLDVGGGADGFHLDSLRGVAPLGDDRDPIRGVHLALQLVVHQNRGVIVRQHDGARSNLSIRGWGRHGDGVRSGGGGPRAVSALASFSGCELAGKGATREAGLGRTFFLMYFFSSAIVPFSTRPVAAASSSRRAELLFGI